MPGDHVLFGELELWMNHGIPSWVQQPHTGHNNESLAYVLMPSGLSLITNLVPFHNHNNRNVQVFRCFIITPSHTFFAAFLQNNNNALHFAGNSRVFVRIFGQYNPVYSGVIHRANGQVPAWLM